MWSRSTADTTKIYNLNSGNVGVGTNSAQSRLDVNSSAAGGLYTQFRITNPSASSGNSSSFALMTPNNTLSTDRNWGLITNQTAHGNFEIQSSTSNSAIPSATQFTINSNGNIGIGTTLITDKLDVQGTGQFSNNFDGSTVFIKGNNAFSELTLISQSAGLSIYASPQSSPQTPFGGGTLLVGRPD